MGCMALEQTSYDKGGEKLKAQTSDMNIYIYIYQYRVEEMGV